MEKTHVSSLSHAFRNRWNLKSEINESWRKYFSKYFELNRRMKSLLIEFIELYITQIIYLRRLYPTQIFAKRKAYCLPVFKSIYPQLNNYLKGCMTSINHLLEMNQLNKIEVLIFSDDDNESPESFVINILQQFSIPESDKYLMEIHEFFRHSIYDLELKCKTLSKSKRSSKFKVLLHTKEKAYQKLSNESKYQVRILRHWKIVNKLFFAGFPLDQIAWR